MPNSFHGGEYALLDSLSDGLYICDNERRILFWNRAAERISGWASGEVVGRRCLDNILCHVDKDGVRLCGKDTCPLHRAMVTDSSSAQPVIVFGRTKAGVRKPLQVSIAPLHDAQGQVVGGVESFRDFSDAYLDLERARRIQLLALKRELPRDSRVRVSTYYLPHDMVGGDFVAIERLDENRYGFLLADVMGHGVAAALHAMYLSALWDRYHSTLVAPAEFARLVNRELCQVVKDESFAVAVCGVLDASARTVRYSSAGGPPMLVMHPDGAVSTLDAAGMPFGTFKESEYEDATFACRSGDALLLFTDGAIEVQDAGGRLLNAAGLIDVLKGQGYPQAEFKIDAVQRALVNYSNVIRLNDDVTFLEIRFA